jgi:TonB family protein
MAAQFFKEYKVYSQENEGDLAEAEWKNMVHQLDLAADGMLTCDARDVNAMYSYLGVHASMLKLSSAEVHLEVALGDASDQEGIRLARSYRDSVLDTALLELEGAYYYGMANAKPGEYSYFKQTLKDAFLKAHRPWRSPEAPWSSKSSVKKKPEVRGGSNTVVKASPAPKAGPAIAAPAPTPTLPRCAQPHKDATTTRRVEPDYPDLARQQGAVGTVQVKVSLSATGSVVSTSVYKSSGNGALDRAALAAARVSSYSPGIEACEPVPDTLLFRADFNGQ